MVEIPKRGDLIWIDFNPQAGHEQAGRRPALVLTSERYNRATGMLMACPVTSRVKGYPLEIALPVGLEISGVILVHQARALDWQARKAVVIEAAPPQTVKAVLAALNTLLEEE